MSLSERPAMRTALARLQSCRSAPGLSSPARLPHAANRTRGARSSPGSSGADVGKTARAAAAAVAGQADPLDSHALAIMVPSETAPVDKLIADLEARVGHVSKVDNWVLLGQALGPQGSRDRRSGLLPQRRCLRRPGAAARPQEHPGAGAADPPAAEQPPVRPGARDRRGGARQARRSPADARLDLRRRPGARRLPGGRRTAGAADDESQALSALL